MQPSLCPRAFRGAVTLLLCFFTAVGMAAGQDAAPAGGAGGKKPAPAKGAPAGKEGADAAAPPAPSTQGLIPFGKMLPLGEKHLVLEIPSFKEGIPSSTLRAASMTRMDDDNMFLEKMDIRLYGPPSQPEKDMRVQLKTAIYHMPTQILASDERSRISRVDFDLQGDSMIFDTATGQGKMVGNVKMVIYNASSFMKGSKDAEAGPEAAKPDDKKGKNDKPAPGAAAPAPAPASSPSPAASAPGAKSSPEKK